MKTRKRIYKSFKKTLKAGSPLCDFDDNIADMLGNAYEGGAEPRQINGSIQLYDTNGQKLQNVWGNNHNGINYCWMNSVIYLFLCNKYVVDIFYSRVENLKFIYPNAKAEDGTIDQDIDYVLQYHLENMKDEKIPQNWKYTYRNKYRLAWDIWNLDVNWKEKTWNNKFYETFYDHFNLLNDGEAGRVEKGQIGPAADAFNLFLSVFERTEMSCPPPTKSNPKKRQDWKKLLGETMMVSSTGELCEFLKFGLNNQIIKKSKTGYTCIGFIKSQDHFEADYRNQNRIINVGHYVCYARITKDLWRMFDSGKTWDTVLLTQIIKNNNTFSQDKFNKRGYVVHGLFVRNDFLPKKNENVVETKLTYYSDDLIRKQNLLKWMKDVNAVFDKEEEEEERKEEEEEERKEEEEERKEEERKEEEEDQLTVEGHEERKEEEASSSEFAKDATVLANMAIEDKIKNDEAIAKAVQRFENEKYAEAEAKKAYAEALRRADKDPESWWNQY